MHQVAVRVVDLEDFELGFERTFRCIHPVAFQCSKVGKRKLPRHDEALDHRFGGGRDGLPLLLSPGKIFGGQCTVAEPGPLHGTFAPGVRQLNAGHHVLGFHEPRDTPQWSNVRVRPDAKIAVRDASLIRDGGRFDEHAAGTTQHQPPPMREVEVLRHAVDGRVRGHRRNDNAVSESGFAQGDRRKEQRLVH